MKRLIAIMLCLLLCLSAASCSGGKTEENGSETTGNASQGPSPVIRLIQDSAAVVPGETVDVMLHISNAPLTACFDIYVYAPSRLVYESSNTLHSELIVASNSVEYESTECVVVRGMVATTCDLTDDNICVVTYTVPEDAKSGDELPITLQVPLYQLGTDDSGSDVYSVSANVIIENLTLIVE